MAENEKTTELVKQEKPTPVAMTVGNGFAITTLEEAYRVATGYSRSSLVPDIFRGKPDDCFVAIELAMRLNESPWAVMQAMYVVHGKPGFEAKFVIGRINKSGLFKDPLEFEVEGTDPFNEKYRVRAYATRVRTGKTLYGPWIDWTLIKKENWDKPRKDTPSKWVTMPGQMFLYRAASWFCNAYCPEVKVGIPMADELEDIGPRHVDSTEVRGVAGVKARIMERNGKTTSGTGTDMTSSSSVQAREAGGGEVPKGSGVMPTEPAQDTGRGGGESIMQPPSAPEDVAEAEKTAKEKFGTPDEELFVCLTCKSKGRPFEYTATQIAEAKGGCPRCLLASDLVPKVEAEDTPPAPKTTKTKMAVVYRCLKCNKEYTEKPAKGCECGARLGFKKLGG